MIAEVMNMKADKEKTGTYLMIALSAAGFFFALSVRRKQARQLPRV